MFISTQLGDVAVHFLKAEWMQTEEVGAQQCLAPAFSCYVPQREETPPDTPQIFLRVHTDLCWLYLES